MEGPPLTPPHHLLPYQSCVTPRQRRTMQHHQCVIDDAAGVTFRSHLLCFTHHLPVCVSLFVRADRRDGIDPVVVEVLLNVSLH